MSRVFYFFSVIVLAVVVFSLDSSHAAAAEAPEELKGAAEESELKHNQQMSFQWENDQHYKELVTFFENLSAREVKLIVAKINSTIDENKHYFEGLDDDLSSPYDDLLYSLKESMYFWMVKDVLTKGNFLKDKAEGYIPKLGEFEKWKLSTLQDMFGIGVKSINDFNLEEFSTDNIRTFLTKHVENGDYSWLVNQLIEDDLDVSQEFIDDFAEPLEVPKALLEAIFGGLW